VLRRLALPAALLLAAALPATAQAHASLLATDPPAGSVVAHPPRRIVLHFDQQVKDAGTTAVDSSGGSVLDGHAHPAPGDVRALVVPLRPGLPDGDYTVRWQVVSTDGHIVSGVMAIGAGSGRPPPQAASTETSALDWPFLIARFAYFGGLTVLIGGAVYRVAVFDRVIATVTGRPGETARLRERSRAGMVLLAAAVLMLGGGWVALTREGAEVAGVSFWQAFNHGGPVGSALAATRFGREFGRGIDLGAAFCVVAAAAFAAARRSRAAALALAVPAVLLGGWAIVVPGLSGHAGDPGLGLPTVVVDALHTGAAAVWIGGLVQLAVVTPYATGGLRGDERHRVRTALAARFSRIALWSVAVLAATGAGRALWALGAPAQLWDTRYGRTLLVKSVLLALLVAIGYGNRQVLDRFDDLRRRVGVEAGLLAAVIAAVALLTDLPPANSPGLAAASPVPAPRGAPVSLRLTGGARLALWPGVAGADVVALRVPGRTRSVTAVPARGGAPAPLAAQPDGSFAGVLRSLPQGRSTILFEAGTRTWAATVTLGPRSAAPPVPAAPAATGPVAAAAAGDLALGVQRSGNRHVRLTLLAPTGAAVPDALALVDGHVATPCPGVRGVCYQAPASPAAATLGVSIRRPGRPRVTARVRLAAAGARPAARLLARAAAAFRGLRSLRSENVLASGPGRAVSTTYIVQAPDRLSIDVHGGERARIIGTTRWDRNPDGTWTRSKTAAVRQPDPFWAPTARAVYVAGRGARTIQLTLVQPGGPTFFRLWIDRRTRLVTRLRMVTAAHFMRERELDPNRAPPVVPPP
jgi:copper transport protein